MLVAYFFRISCHQERTFLAGIWEVQASTHIELMGRISSNGPKLRSTNTFLGTWFGIAAVLCISGFFFSFGVEGANKLKIGGISMN